MLFFERERPENEWNKIKLNNILKQLLHGLLF